MQKLKLTNGEEFEYTNAVFSREDNTLEFTFAPQHTHDDIFNQFSEYGETYEENVLNTIKLVDIEGNVLGIWEGFNSLINIQNNLSFTFGLDGSKIPNSTVKITLLKETISDEYKRVKEAELQSLSEMNMMLMLALAETAEINAQDKLSTEVALVELVEILRERGVI